MASGVEVPRNQTPRWWRRFIVTSRRKNIFAYIEIAAAIAAESFDHWCAVFDKVKCCVEPVLTPSEAVAHPLFQERKMVVEVPRPGGGTSRQIGNPISLSSHPPQYRHVGREPGQDADEVLAGLGLASEDIARLKAAKVIV